jgi:hypothetical protein
LSRTRGRTRTSGHGTSGRGRGVGALLRGPTASPIRARIPEKGGDRPRRC